MHDPTGVITSLENAPAIIVPMVREISPEIVKRRPRPGKWSAHEHACHLAVVHRIFLPRLDLMLNDSRSRIVPYQPDRDEAEDHLLKLNLEESLRRFQAERKSLVERLKQLRPEDWQRTTEHPEYTHYSIYIMFRHLALHDLFHGYRIEELMLKRDWD